MIFNCPSYKRMDKGIRVLLCTLFKASQKHLLRYQKKRLTARYEKECCEAKVGM